MITDTTFRHRGLYVEGRYFGNDGEQATSFAFALACEYMRPIKVWFNAPNESIPTVPITTAHPPTVAA